MVHAIRIHQTGGPEVMKWEEVEVGDPGPGQIRLKNAAAGLNYIDTYHRSGLYKLPLPLNLGMEGAGTVTAVGPGVTDIKVGDRVAYASQPLGSYSEERLMQADRVVVLPDGISDQQAAGMMLKGMTVEYLLRRTYKVKAGDTVLFHAAAGGVGLIFGQWAKALGATVIGTVGSDEKAKLAREHGYDHVINYKSENFVERVKEITKGEGVPVVYDGVGKDTWAGSLDCLRPLGLMVSFGNASGPVGPVDIGILAPKGSLFVTRPTLVTYTARREDLVGSANALFDVVKSGKVKIEIKQTYALKDAARAHADLESRKTTGSTLLLP
ncbi:MAG TPA: quinone oxidoreductase [Ferrovibrio sp.]|jgi:NADPH2:quinone reductase|uniref:quinone oxidoreductase family protein n=1 Tax=Ferrovibrio sp. TaxID=1917215 RepID=UPI002B4AE036|nr:quinone oxidoreductase [Ferrovibrio sp.]HLT76327.1 quinone oxidoreductase [Ferrovibrio sp.]